MTAARPRGRPSLRVLRGGRTAHPESSAPTPLSDAHGQPFEIERDGVLYRRAPDQELARRHRQADALREQIRTRAGTRGLRLANKLVDLACFEMLDEQLAVLRAIGWILVSNGRQDLWRLAYLEFNRGSLYVVGDETRFLLNEPTATPTPLREDNQDDVA